MKAINAAILAVVQVSVVVAVLYVTGGPIRFMTLVFLWTLNVAIAEYRRVPR